jgi:uncharacterized protein YndB with AHSA1/START domain
MTERQVSVSRVIPAPAEKIFDVLASPAGHADMDGSGSVRAAVSGPERLELGSKFRMDMKLGVPYKISSTVVEFEENRLIAWAHLGKHRWRFELEPVEAGTRVTETFDWSTALVPKAIELMGYPEKHPAGMERTLERLEELVTANDA